MGAAPLKYFGVWTLFLPLYSGPDFTGYPECFGHPVWSHPDDGFPT